ncbi:MAG TPA: PaaI family thioesterase [Thermoplasmata archaeon]|nr:PaaI family thioesterase [Thermoplasmata archaeon]
MPRPAPNVEPKPSRPPRDWMARIGGFHWEVGFSIDPARTREGSCVVSGTVEARHLNLNQVVHGGVYSTILDTSMGGAVVTLLARGETAATASLNVEFLRPAREGQTLRAIGKVIRRGRHLAFVDGVLEDEEGRRLAQAQGTWYIWSSSDGTWGRGRDHRASDAQPPPARNRS